MLIFRKTYFLLAILLFGVELIIAFYVRDDFIRPFLGDLLVVQLMYCGLMAFLKLKPATAGISILIFSWLVEFSQYFKLIRLLRLEDEFWAHLLLGSAFHWLDILMYTLGIGLVLLIERWRKLTWQ